MLNFTSDGVMYEGFSGVSEKNMHTYKAGLVVVVLFDGEVDTWLATDQVGVANLRLYYQDRYEADLTQLKLIVSQIDYMNALSGF